jgi:hypothetical protein
MGLKVAAALVVEAKIVDPAGTATAAIRKKEECLYNSNRSHSSNAIWTPSATIHRLLEKLQMSEALGYVYRRDGE